MRISTIRPNLLRLSDYDKEDIFLVIDTFRATSTLAVLAESGVENIFIVKNQEEARILQKQLCPGCLLIGEEKGLKIKGFDYGNSPSILYKKNLENKSVVFTSSNGAKTLILLKNKKNVFLGALVNLSSISKKVSKLAAKEKKNVIIIPAGHQGNPKEYVLEDWITSVLIARKISELTEFPIVTQDDFWDKTIDVLDEKSTLEKLLINSPNGMYLAELGFEKDVIFSISVDKIGNFLKVKKWLKINDYDCVVLE
ncbi:MAG: 2-phosphosulfolactate phosphatase [Candidatus Heimdallarchaeaceae archaeon]